MRIWSLRTVRSRICWESSEAEDAAMGGRFLDKRVGSFGGEGMRYRRAFEKGMVSGRSDREGRQEGCPGDRGSDLSRPDLTAAARNIETFSSKSQTRNMSGSPKHGVN